MHDADIKRIIDELLTGHIELHLGRMFGYPAYYFGKKLCLCILENGICLKLPEQRTAELMTADPNISTFTPYGRRKMREWVKISLENADQYRDYLTVIEESILYLQTKT